MKRKRSANENLALALESVLDDGREEVIHQFLARNPDAIPWAHGSRVWSKFRLGTNFVTDFLCVGPPRSNGISPTVTMIEIERADKKMFTANGDPSAVVTHAVRQVQDWKQWVSANRQYVARDILDRWDESVPVREPVLGGEYWNPEYILRHFAVFYYVIVGRRTFLRVPERLRLEQMNDDLANIKIMTYDVLIDRLI